MKSYEEMEFHPECERLVQILCAKTQNTNPLFFRVLVSYYFTLAASMMRASIMTPDRGQIPINMYAINLAPSGAGKGHSINIIEEQVIDQFRQNFLDITFPALAERNLANIAQKRAISKQTDIDAEVQKAEKEFASIGPMLFTFDSGTAPAVKQARHKLLMAEAGSLNLQIDEIGNNLLNNAEVLSIFLELFDVGKIKQKLIKNTAENSRFEEIIGRTPTNLMLFGTPSRLLMGGKTEEEFYAMLEEGYARRCFFGYLKQHTRNLDLTPQEILDLRTDTSTSKFLEDLSDHMGDLADMAYINRKLKMSDDVALLFIEYQLQCERAAEELPDHEEAKKAELSHRYFKALKVSGTYAFIDECDEITEDHAYQAIKLAENSGMAFDALRNRDRPYVKLAKYISDVKRPLTQADLVEDLPFYKGNVQQKQEMMSLAIAYGYQNNILIKKTFNDGIEFFQGESLEPADLDKMIVSYSDDIAHDYRADFAPFDKLHVLTQKDGLHWANHQFVEGHRCEDKAIAGFNMIVLDIDCGVSMSTAQMLLKEYKALFYTTKRHTKDDHRFRVILPMNYKLKLNARDYREFMENLFEWLPFDVDRATGQRARKWLSHDGYYEYQDGYLLDILPFIPKTSKNETYKQQILDQQGMDNLERWVVNHTGDGNRNNMVLRYAMVLVDAGFDFDTIRQKVFSMNQKLDDPLLESELMGTVMVTVSKTLAKQ